MASKADLQALLARHIGADNGISAEAAAALIGTDTRHVRALVTELRLEGIAICGHPATGYFIAATDEEAVEHCLWLYARAIKTLKLISVMRNVALPELRGQLRLPT